MTDVGRAAGAGVLSVEFSKRATVPEAELKQARAFAKELSGLAEKGQEPSAATLERGRRILGRLEQRTEAFAFNAAVAAGLDDGDIDKGVKVVERNVRHLENAARTLRMTLDNF